jgi:tetratricopeptide (TPR) repeat protein
MLALLVDVNALPGTFVADDIAIVVRNPGVASLNLAATFAADYWGGQGFDKLYRPLTILSFSLNRAAFGPGPLSFHAVNALLHAGATFLFALSLLALGFDLPLTATAAALFAVHPIHADVVSVVVGRSELLVAVFLFAALWLALRGGRRAWPLVAACYLAALLSKEHALVFVPLLVVADAFAAPSPGPAWRRRAPFYVLLLGVTAAWALVRHGVILASPSPASLIYAADNPLVGAGLLTRLLTALKVNLLYLANLLYPLRLQSVYSGPGLRIVDSPFSAWGGAVLCYGALCVALAARGWRARSGYGFGIPLFFVGFAVTANLFTVITVLMADRFAYLPSAGACLAVAGVLLLPGARAASRTAKRLALLLPVGCVVLLAALTVNRNAAFQHPGGFWESVTRIDPQNVRAWFFLAQARLDAHQPREAERALVQAIQVDPSFPDASIAYSLLLLEQGRAAEAETAARRGIAAAPGGVGLAQFALARALLERKRPAEALDLLDSVEALYESDAGYWKARGTALEALGRAREAIKAFGKALGGGGDSDVLWRLSSLLLQVGAYPECEKTLLDLLSRGETAPAYNMLGVVQALQGRDDEAERSFTNAIRLDPAAEQYRDNLGRLSLRTLHRRP